MKPPPFDYVHATQVSDAVDLLASSTREVKVLAGGQSLLPVLNMRMAHPEVLVDITGITDAGELRVDESGRLHIPLTARQSVVANDPHVRRGWPLLAAAISHIGHPQIRNSGTICGSLAHADSAAELPAVMVALGATMHAASVRGRREIPAPDFILGTFMTALEPDELLLEVVIDQLPAGTRWGFEEFAPRRGDFATAGAVVTARCDGLQITDAEAVLFGLQGAPTRATSVSGLLRGADKTVDTIRSAAAHAADGTEPFEDIHASAAFRRELAEQLTRAALTSALEVSA